MPHTLSLSEIPTHNHGGGAHQHIFQTGFGVQAGSSTIGVTGDVDRYVNTSGAIIQSEGGSGGHDHGLSSGGTHNHELSLDASGEHSHTVTFDNRPAAVGLFFIQKV
jgi:hypothetical protein